MNKRALVEKRLDLLYLGGASVLLTALFFLMGPKGLSTPSWMWIILYTFSFTHFGATYFLFYGRGLHRTHPILGLFLPTSVFVLLLYLSFQNEGDGLVPVAQAAFIYLHWHFLKQAFGASLFLGRPEPQSRASQFLGFQRRFLLFSFILVGISGYLQTQLKANGLEIFSLVIPTFPIPKTLGTLTIWMSLLAVVGMVAMISYGRIKKVPGSLGLSAIVPLLALLVWFSPSLTGLDLVAFLPIFHGLQHLPFVHSRIQTTQAPYQVTYALLFFALAAALFLGLPHGLGAVTNLPLDSATAMVAVFVNLHHYLMEGVLWKRQPSKV